MPQISPHLLFSLDPSYRSNTLSWITENLSKIKCDSIVISGMSGLLVASVADTLNKNIVIVRKEKDTTHSDFNIEGVPPYKFVIIDDLIGSGDTVKRMYSLAKKYTQQEYLSKMITYSEASCVGILLYHNEEMFTQKNPITKLYPCIGIDIK